MPPAGLIASIEAVLFDLDGTLIDSAPDLAGAANDMRVARGLPAMPYEALRPMVGAGARGMVGRAFAVRPIDPDYEALRAEFLQRYEARMTRETDVFASVPAMLHTLAGRGLRWGIVTNKLSRYAEPLVAALAALDGAATLVCGDTTDHAKPHPAPLLEAARRLALPASACVYVGDDLRDVLAGRAAGMTTVAAAWGYLGDGESIYAWGADHLISEPPELLNLLAMA